MGNTSMELAKQQFDRALQDPYSRWVTTSRVKKALDHLREAWTEDFAPVVTLLTERWLNDINLAISELSAQWNSDIDDALNNTLLVVAHGANGAVARPEGATAVYWIGTVEPVNAQDGDLWTDLS